MREELKKIEQLLIRNGWVFSQYSSDEPKTVYFVKQYDENTVMLEAALAPESLGVYGDYGVCSVELMKYGEGDWPFIRYDFDRMNEILDDAEQDILKAGIPFRANFGFAEAIERSIGRNIDLRRRYSLDRLAIEDHGDYPHEPDMEGKDI